MAANPLTFLEMEAFERKTLVSLSAWEADLIMRLDNAVLDAIAGNSANAPARTSDGEPAPPLEVTPDDTQGARALFRGLAARKAKTPSKT